MFPKVQCICRLWFCWCGRPLPIRWHSTACSCRLDSGEGRWKEYPLYSPAVGRFVDPWLWHLPCQTAPLPESLPVPVVCCLSIFRTSTDYCNCFRTSSFPHSITPSLDYDSVSDPVTDAFLGPLVILTTVGPSFRTLCCSDNKNSRPKAAFLLYLVDTIDAIGNTPTNSICRWDICFLLPRKPAQYQVGKIILLLAPVWCLKQNYFRYFT